MKNFLKINYCSCLIFVFFIVFFSCKKKGNDTAPTPSPTPVQPAVVTPAIHPESLGSFSETVLSYSVDYLFDNPYTKTAVLDSIAINLPLDFSVEDDRYEVLYVRTKSEPTAQDWEYAELGEVKLKNNSGFLYFSSDSWVGNFQYLEEGIYKIYWLFKDVKDLEYQAFFIEIVKKSEFSQLDQGFYGFTPQAEKNIYTWDEDLTKIKIDYTSEIPSEQIDTHAHYLIVQRMVLNPRTVLLLPAVEISGIQLQKDGFSTYLNLENLNYAKILLQSYIVNLSHNPKKFNKTITLADCFFEVQ